MKIEKLEMPKGKCEYYKELGLNTTEPVYQICMSELIKDENRIFNFSGVSCLSPKDVRKKLGRCHYQFDSWYRKYNWFVTYNGYVYQLSSSVRGTDVRFIEGDDKNKEEVSWLFFQELIKFFEDENKNNTPE